MVLENTRMIVLKNKLITNRFTYEQAASGSYNVNATRSSALILKLKPYEKININFQVHDHVHIGIPDR